MNPLMQMMGNYTNSNMSNISGLLQLMNSRNPQEVMGNLMRQNPRFVQFVNENKGKTPEEISKSYGLDFAQVRKMIGK